MTEGLVWAAWAVVVLGAWYSAADRGWWAYLARRAGDDLAPAALWLGIVAVVFGATGSGLVAAALVAGGAALIVVAVNEYRDGQRRELERVERAVAAARADAIADAVQGEVRALRRDLGVVSATLADRIEQAVEDILDDPTA